MEAVAAVPTLEALRVPTKFEGEENRRKFRKAMRDLADRTSLSYNIAGSGAYMFPTFYIELDKDTGDVSIHPFDSEAEKHLNNGLTPRGALTRSRRPREGGEGAISRAVKTSVPRISIEQFVEELPTGLNLEREDSPGRHYWYSFSLPQLYSLTVGDPTDAAQMILSKTQKAGITPTHYVLLPGDIIGLGPVTGSR